MNFLHGTTIEQVERKRKEMKNKNRKKPKKEKVEDLKRFVEKAGEDPIVWIIPKHTETHTE